MTKYVVTAVLLCVGLTACQTAVSPHAQMPMNVNHGFDSTPVFNPGDEYPAPRMLDLSAITTLDALMPKLLDKRVIFVGETHDRYDHHLNQLEIIRRVRDSSVEMAIGMEYFQQPFQPALDDYIDGKIDEMDFLRKSEYYQRWRIDYRNYRPIIQYAKEKGIRLIALDLSEELRKKITHNDLANLSDAEKAQMPTEIDRSNSGYRDMLQAIFAMHPNSSDFERFVETQLSRDESMAQTAAKYLREHPKARMVILTGGGHMVYGYGIPSRLKRRIDAPSAVVLNDSLREYDAEVGDYLLMPNPVRLPKEARLGVVLDTAKPGELTINEFSEGSPAIAAGLEKGDRLLSIDGQAVGEMADLKIALLDKNPGDKVQLLVRRTGWFGSQSELSLEVELY